MTNRQCKLTAGSRAHKQQKYRLATATVIHSEGSLEAALLRLTGASPEKEDAA